MCYLTLSLVGFLQKNILYMSQSYSAWNNLRTCLNFPDIVSELTWLLDCANIIGNLRNSIQAFQYCNNSLHIKYTYSYLLIIQNIISTIHGFFHIIWTNFVKILIFAYIVIVCWVFNIITILSKCNSYFRQNDWNTIVLNSDN